MNDLFITADNKYIIIRPACERPTTEQPTRKVGRVRRVRNLLAIPDQEFLDRSIATMLAAFKRWRANPSEANAGMLAHYAADCWSFALTLKGETV